MKGLLLILIGLGEGIVVGTALIAFLLVLDVIPRVIRFSDGCREQIIIYQWLIILGVFIAINLQLYDVRLPQFYFLNYILVIVCGLVFGIFIGLLAGALTEVLKVLPVLSRRLKMEEEMKILLVIIILGKTIGSLIYWLLPQIWI
ncbi:stage V sporulation protein AB [Halobacteroides halobius]|nr:stage V sporulation protein AB [Halobacteroides halobius]